MSSRVEDNAVMRRLRRLQDQYEAFIADPDARILRWRIKDDERRMIDAFVAIQGDARLEGAPDLVVVLSSPFDDPRTHGWTLREELEAQYELARRDPPCGAEDEPEVELDWVAPPLAGETDDVDALVEAATSLAEHYGARLDCVTLGLRPRSIHDLDAWVGWLRRFASASNRWVRAIVLDHALGPRLDALAEAEPRRVRTRSADLDMPGAYLELSRGRPEDRSPTAQIRRGFVGMLVAAERGSVQEAVEISDPALRLAAQEDRWDLVATLLLARGGLLDADQPSAAVECFEGAAAAAEWSRRGGDRAGAPLEVQARMAEGSTLLRLQRWDDAARAYQHAGRLAEARDDTFTALDAWRLAGLAHERSGRVGPAWRCAHLALVLGESMSVGERRCTSLNHAAEILLRLADAGPPPEDVAPSREALRRRIDAVLGHHQDHEESA